MRSLQHKAQLLTVKRPLDGNGTKFDAEKLEQSVIQLGTTIHF